MLRCNTLFACGLFALACLPLASLPRTAHAQEAEDKVSQQASDLEASLGKLRDGSPEAADVMLKLVELYHQNGRALGLIRIANRFVVAQAAHPQHRAMMLKLIDGLEANARNKDLVNICRQFLARYPDDGQCGHVEIVLAAALDQLGDRKASAAAHEAVWKRQGDKPAGRASGVTAVWLYQQQNNQESFIKAAEISESMLAKVKPGEFPVHMGRQAVYWWQRANDWAKSNHAASTMFKRGLKLEPEVERDLHYQMGENYSRLGQRANAIDSFQKARKIRDSVDLHGRLIYEHHYAGSKPQDMEGLVREYVQKYDQRYDRWQHLIILGHAYLRAQDKDRAAGVFREALPFDARSHEAAQHFVGANGDTPEKFADSERALQDALNRNPKDAYYLRYTLAIDLYRDRLKDVAKSKAMVRELIAKSPANEGYTQGALHWLLSETKDKGEFQALVPELIRAHVQNAHWNSFRTFLGNWAKEARKNKESEERGKLLWAALEAANQTPDYKDWIEADNQDRGISQAARQRLLEPGRFAKLTDEQAYKAARDQAESFRHQGSNEQRARAIPVYGQLAKRLPKDYQIAIWYLEVASDFGPPEVAKEAALHLLKIPPQSNNSDTWRRLFAVADKLMDAELVKQSLQYALQSQEKFGFDQNNASGIGDVLEKYGLKDEAKAYWKRSLELDRNHWESRSCAERLANRVDPAQKIAFIQELSTHNCDMHGAYAMWLAGEFLKTGDLKQFEDVLRKSKARQEQRPFRNWAIEEWPLRSWVDTYRNGKDVNGKDGATEADKRIVFKTIRDLDVSRASAIAIAALLELPPEPKQTPMERLLEYGRATRLVQDGSHDWDTLMPYAQAAIARKDYVASATLLTAMLSNIGNVDKQRLDAGRERVAQSYARLGGVGLAIDESSPLAPLLQAALYLRLGDERLAFDAYAANKKLFDDHKLELPIDLVTFVADNLIAAGGDENLEKAEEILRAWLVKFSEAMEIEPATKAGVQLLLAKNYYKGQRFDVARAEYTTVINRYPSTGQAVEAEFGIGECFMSQKVYDQAEQIFTKLATSSDRDIVIRAEFLRGVLAGRRGDSDEARDIFRKVLEMVPSVELANQALFNLAEVYGSEQRYMDQLELLRTVGRLGRASKRWHNPGTALSIVVQDSDLGISRGHAKIPVRVTTEPGGDEETIYLYSGGAGKGLFRADLETRLGQVTKNDKVLQLTGKDTIKCDYPAEFKAEFKTVPLPDAEIRIAASADFEVASAKIIDVEKETLSQRLEREAREQEESDQRVSQGRPANQIKPGNPLYFRVKDADRDLSDEADKLPVKLVASSGDQVEVVLIENGPHTGIFEGQCTTAELPAGALASDTAIDHSPLMAIDRDPATFWLSEPDGATPKWLSIDMKDLHPVARVKIQTPKAGDHSPVRGDLFGSHDGRFWFRVASVPPREPVDKVVGEYGAMTLRLYSGNFTNFSNWKQIVEMSKVRQPAQQGPVDTIAWSRPTEGDDAKQPMAALWHGKFVQPTAGAVRFQVAGQSTALSVDGQLELPIGPGNRTVDVWLDRGAHDLVIFAAGNQNATQLGALVARENLNESEVVLQPFRASDFNLQQPGADPAPTREPAQIEVTETAWTFRFAPYELRHVKLAILEYRGEAVAINHVEVGPPGDASPYIPTQADVLSLAGNDSLEIAAGDQIVASYTDEFNQSASSRNQLLSVKLMATYFNGHTTPIGYDFDRQPSGAVVNIRKEVKRVEPGERFVVEIVDYDLDQSPASDTAKFTVRVNDGEPLALEATETEPFSGMFTKEVDTSAKSETGKLTVKAGDRIYVTYIDEQNTFPGHSVPRESVVYVNEPTEAKIRIVETRMIPPPKNSTAAPRLSYVPEDPKKTTSNVAFEAPLTVEVIDPDAAKDSRSRVTVQLQTSGGVKVEVECAVSNLVAPQAARTIRGAETQALEDGRFVGQVILQLGGKDSPTIVPLTPNMPRGLVGGGKLSEEDKGSQGETLVTRVLNVTGKDQIAAGYLDQLRPDKKPAAVIAKGRLIANGTLAVTDREYQKNVESLHVGEKMFLLVTDADLDVSDERDRATVEISSSRGEQETIQLEETLAHSGVFTGSIVLRPAEKPAPGNLSVDDPAIECYFGDQLKLKYVDQAASTESGTLVIDLELPVVIGTDGLVAAFSKTFSDESIAVETQFHIAESYFELFKSHKKLARDDEQKTDLEAGRRVLREVMEDYPNPKYAPRIAYLLGQFAQELEQWDEAIDAYELIVRQYPDSLLAPDAQFKLAQCYEEAGDFDNALEAYVTLAATYPKSPLIANVMVRISEYFWKKEEFDVAAQVGEKFLERFDGHQWASRMAFRIGQCHYKAKEYMAAGQAFDRFAKIFPDDPLCSDSLFWAGESYRMGTNDREAFRRYNRCRWDHPESEAAKYARGRLALPAMLRQFEAEANVE